MNRCCQCGEETNFMKLKNGKWGCEKCCNEIGREQNRIRAKIEELFGDEGESLLPSIIELINFCYNETSINKIEHLTKSLEAIECYYEIVNTVTPDNMKWELIKYKNIVKEIKKHCKSVLGNPEHTIVSKGALMQIILDQIEELEGLIADDE